MYFNISTTNLFNLIIISAGIGICILCFIQASAAKYVALRLQRYYQILFLIIILYVSAHLVRQLMDGTPGSRAATVLQIITIVEVQSAGIMTYIVSLIFLYFVKDDKTEKRFRILSTGKGIAANAGHEHPAICRKDGEYELVIYRHSPAVAAMNGIPFKEHAFELHPGDNLFVYTDGVPEAADSDNRFFGTEKMLNALNRDPHAVPEEALSNVLADIHSFVGGAEQFDDITMLCIKYNGPTGKKQAS